MTRTLIRTLGAITTVVSCVSAMLAERVSVFVDITKIKNCYYEQKQYIFMVIPHKERIRMSVHPIIHVQKYPGIKGHYTSSYFGLYIYHKIFLIFEVHILFQEFKH